MLRTKTIFSRSGHTLNLPATDRHTAEHAGMAWSVACRPLFCADTEGNPVIIPDRRAVVRTDTMQPLGVVGMGYTPFQNADLFAFFRQVCDPDTTIEAVGTFDGGKTVWAQARIPSLNVTIGSDVSYGCLLISNSHDGSATLKICPTTVRIVCKNTLNFANGIAKKKGTLQAVRHSQNIKESVNGIANDYLQAVAQWHGAAESYKALATVGSSDVNFQKMMLSAWNLTESDVHKSNETERSRTIRMNRMQAVDRIRASETCNVPGTKDTLFSDIQAITEYIDHVADISTDSDFAMFGGGADIKQRALASALAMV